jgi:serine/threonine protein kinase
MIPGYEIIDLIYTGARTAVYRAIDLTNNRSVAIKVLTATAPTFSQLWQFRQQYEISRQLHHPQIIEIYRIEPYQNGYALVMEDFQGISLQQWLDKSPLALEPKLKIAIDLILALQALGQHRIIHKDIKPANILINPDTHQVKLIDFGISSRLPEESLEVVNVNTLEGSLAYIAPEQTGRMNRGIDYRCDFYSLGVTLFELFTGQLPFWATDSLGWVHCHLAQIATPAHRVDPQVPLAISQIIAKLMAKNADNRYQSTLGIKYDLDECLHQLQQTGAIAEFAIAQRDPDSRTALRTRSRSPNLARYLR